MNSKTRILTIALSVALVLSVVAPGLAAAGDGGLTIDVEQTDVVEVTVSDDAVGVANATVNVTVDDGNASYVDAGEYETDENGTVELSVPEETVDVTLTAIDENRTAERSVTLEAEEPALSVSVAQAADGSATVSVTEDGAAVENATVNVTVDGNATYDGAGEYETDENGTVDLPAPGETVTVSVTATVEDRVAETSKVLEADPALSVSVQQADDGSATASVTIADESVAGAAVNVTTDDENASYEGTGEYETGEDGTVDLPAPNETVDVTVTAEFDNETASTSATLAAVEDGPEFESFGQQVSAFVHGLLNGPADENATIGQQVAEFVTSNNPGNAPDHAGPKNDTGKPAHAGPGGEAGQPDHAGSGNGPDGDRPDHAGPDGEKGAQKDDRGKDRANDGSNDGDDERDGGPPDDRGNGAGSP